MSGLVRFMLTGKATGTLPVPEAREAALQAAQEGIVLLANRGQLPLEPGPVALFGGGAEHTLVCGTGSGFVYCPYMVSVRQGLEAGGFTILTEGWLERAARARRRAPADRRHPLWQRRFNGEEKRGEDPLVTAEDLVACGDCETAAYVISRNAGEEADRRNVPGDYQLSENEVENLRRLSAHFPRFVVILNTCIIDAKPIVECGAAIVLLGQAGMEAGTALCDVLTGKVSPSGHLTDTWALRYADYPASGSFAMNDGDADVERYEEGVFVGYRHFDRAQLPVLFPFGFGLSYTSFSIQVQDCACSWQGITVRARVRNTGKAAGKAVLQLYTSSPEEEVQRPFRELRAFAKTPVLAPGAETEVIFSMDPRDMAYFSEKRSAFVLAGGRSRVYLGEHSRALFPVMDIDLDRGCIVARVHSVLEPQERLPEKAYSPAPPLDAAQVPVFSLLSQDCPVRELAPEPEEPPRYCPEGENVSEGIPVPRVPHATFMQVARGEVSPEAFVASLDLGVLLRLVAGDACQTRHAVLSRPQQENLRTRFHRMASGRTTALFLKPLGIPAMSLADGPAGLHLIGSPAAAYPVGMVQAQSWNPEILAGVGDSYGQEMEVYHVTICLGPGMNLHRDPLCGRNFEYYSEDPVLTGKLAAAFTRGLQENHPGRGVAIKHFACNNQETNRLDMDAEVSVRALRELYLKGFEICVKEASPMSLMTAYNRLNGTYSGARRDLLTTILRGEWGFQGLIMSDWETKSQKGRDYRAGTDLVMGGFPAEIIADCVHGMGPRFDRDGSVHLDRFSFYSVLRRDIEAWGAFVPDRNGPDRIRVPVTGHVGVRARAAEVLGLCEVEKGPEGTAVIYHGYDKGAMVTMGRLQDAALHVLSILQGVPLQLALQAEDTPPKREKTSGSA